MFDEEFQELKRENFNLKLRIYFLEEQSLSSDQINDGAYNEHLSYIQQLRNENEQLRRRAESQNGTTDLSTTIYNYDNEEERRYLRDELEKSHREIEYLRQQSQANEKDKTIIPTGQSFQTTTNSIDSGLDTSTPAMSTIYRATHNIQVELNDFKAREPKHLEEIDSLKRQLYLSSQQTNETLRELERARAQIQQYRSEIEQYEQQQSKAERVLQRLQLDYEARIANLVEQQKQQFDDFENYRHEPLLARIRFSYPVKDEEPSFNLDEYRQAIEDRDRIIQQLEETIAETTSRLRAPLNGVLSTNLTSSPWNDERSRNLIEQLENQLKFHLEKIDELRSECVELRRTETNLRSQVDSLTSLINQQTNRSQNFSNSARPFGSNSKLDTVTEDAEQIHELQTAIVQITVQLQTDVENVSGLTNRVSQILRDRDDLLDKVQQLQDEIQQKDSLIRQHGLREREIENRVRQQLSLEIEGLQRKIEQLQDQLRDRDQRLRTTENDKENLQTQTRKNYEKLDLQHNQEKNSLQRQIEAANEEISRLRQQIENERRQAEIVQQNLQQSSLNQLQIDRFEDEIQRQKRQIDELNKLFAEAERELQQERKKFDAENQANRDKISELERSLDAANRISTDSKQEIYQIQISFEEKFQDFQEQLNAADQNRTQRDEEVSFLRQENQQLKNEIRDAENRLNDLIRKNNELKSEINLGETRIRDNEDLVKRNRAEIQRLEQDLDDRTKKFEQQIDAKHDLERKYESLKNELTRVDQEKARLDSEAQLAHEESERLKNEVDRLQVEIRIQIRQEYEEEFRQLTAERAAEVESIQRENEISRLDLERLNQDKNRLEEKLRSVESALIQSKETSESYEFDVRRLRQALEECQNRNQKIEEELSRAFGDEIRQKNERINELEKLVRTGERQTDDDKNRIRKLQVEIQDLTAELEKCRYDYEKNLKNLRQSNEEMIERNLKNQEEKFGQELKKILENRQNQIDQLEGKVHEQQNLIEKLENERDARNFRPNDFQVDLEILIEQLEEKVQTKEKYLQDYSTTVEQHERQIGRLHDELRSRDEQIQSLDVSLSKVERENDELRNISRTNDRDLSQLKENLRNLEQSFQIQQIELEDCRQRRDLAVTDLNVLIEENQTNNERIRFLEEQLRMAQSRTSNSEQIAKFQKIIEDLKEKLRDRENTLQTLQQTVSESDREIEQLRQSHIHGHEDQHRNQILYEQSEEKLRFYLEERDQLISELRKKLSQKEEEINKLRENDLAREATLNLLRSKSRDSDPDSRSEYSAARAPSNVSLRLELQKRDDEIDELRRELHRARQESTPNGRDDSSSNHTGLRFPSHHRNPSKNVGSMSAEQLRYELETALEHNEALMQEISKRSPNITELHNQLLDVRKDLARQKYVNQVLWRKLDALMDIHGSNTRAELMIELANFHDEVELLKAKNQRTNDARSAILNPCSRSSSETSLNKKDSGLESIVDSNRQALIHQQELQRQINDRDEIIRSLTRELNEIRKVQEIELNKLREKFDKSQSDLLDDLNNKQDDLRQARLQIDLLKSSRSQVEQAQDQNQRLQNELKLARKEIDDQKGLIARYEKEITILEKQISTRGHSGEMSIRTSEMAELLEEMRRLRQELERSIVKQNELQAKLDENIRLTRTPKEFTFSGRALSYGEPRSIPIDELRSGNALSSSHDLGERGKYYFVGELEMHEALRRSLADLKVELRGIEGRINEKLRNKFTSLPTDPTIEWLEQRLNSLGQCFVHLDNAYQIVESYWKANLPTKNNLDEHIFNDPNILQENKELKVTQARYVQELQALKQKYKEQSTYMDQVLVQLTKANLKKANADDYLALLLRPTLDVLQKARANMENHLKDSNLNTSSTSNRRARPNRLE